MSSDLGKCLAEYKMSAARYAKIIALMLGSFAVACGMMGGSVFSDDSNIGGRVIMFIFGVLFTLPAVIGVYGLMKSRKNAVRLYERGIAIHNAGTETRFAYDDIAEYSGGSSLIITAKNDAYAESRLDELRAAADLMARLRDEVVVKRLVPDLRKTMADGDLIAFNCGELMGRERADADATEVSGFTVDAAGVKIGETDRQIAWSEIVTWGTEERNSREAQLTLVSTWVFLKTIDQTFRTSVEPLSDREVLLALGKEMSSSKA
jgi:hypothetical protein